MHGEETKTRKPCYAKDDRTMRPICKLFILILLSLTATIGLRCADLILI